MALVVIVRRERDPCGLGLGAPSFSLVTLGDFQHGAPSVKVLHVAGTGTRHAGALAPVFRCARCGPHVPFSCNHRGLPPTRARVQALESNSQPRPVDPSKHAQLVEVPLRAPSPPFEQAASIRPSAEQQTNAGQCQVALHLTLFVDMNSPPLEPTLIRGGGVKGYRAKSL